MKRYPMQRIEENNRMGKTRNLFKKIRDTKGTFNANMGSIKDRNDMDQTEEEDIKKWQEYMEELYKKRSSLPRLIIFFEAEDGEALYSQQKQDWEPTVALIINSLLQNSDLN